MEVAREKLVAPTLFDVVAPRCMPEPSGGMSFRDCFTLASPHATTSTSAQGNSSAENSAHLDTTPAAVEQSTPRKSDARPQDAQSETPDDVSAKDKVADANSEGQAEKSAASDITAHDEPDSEEQQATDEQSTAAAELLAVVSAVATPNQPLPDNAEAGEKPVEADLALDGIETAPPREEKSATEKSVDTVDVLVQPAAAKTAEQVVMLAVEPVQPGESAEQAVKPEVAEATPGVVESVELTDSDVTSEVPLEEFPTVTPDAVQPADSQGSGEQADHDRRQSNENAKKTVAKESEAVSAPQHSSNRPVPVADTPEIDTAVNESTDEEIAADSVEARGNNPTIAAPAPATPSEQATTPAATPSQDIAATTANTNDASVASAATPAADVNVNVASSAQASTPRVPPALLRKAEAQGQAHARPGEIDPARFLTRVVKAFESAQQRDSEVRLRLHPSELGSLSIEVKVQDSALTARLQAETPEARTALLENLPMLRERLAEQGIRIEKFDVDLMDHSDRQPQQSPSEQMPEDSGRRASQARTPTPTAKSIEKETKATSVRGGSASDRLNVVI